MNMLTKIDKLVEKICSKIAIASMAALFFLMCMTGVHVLLRKFATVSVPDTIGLTECGMVVIVFISMGYLQLNKGHIRVDIVVDKFPPRVAAVFDGVILACSSITLFVVMYANVLQIPLQYETQLATSVLKIPIWPFYIVMCIGLFMYAVSTALHAVVAFVKGVVRGKPDAAETAEVTC